MSKQKRSPSGPLLIRRQFCTACLGPTTHVNPPTRHARRPQEGDRVMCQDCGHLMAIGPGKTLRNLTKAEVAWVLAHPAWPLLKAQREDLFHRKGLWG